MMRIHNGTRLLASRRTIARSHNNGVFQTHYNPKPIDIDEIEDLMDISKYYTLKQKREYFEINGLDYDKITEYYHVVKALNNNFNKEDKPKESSLNNMGANFRIVGFAVLFVLNYVFR